MKSQATIWSRYCFKELKYEKYLTPYSAELLIRLKQTLPTLWFKLVERCFVNQFLLSTALLSQKLVSLLCIVILQRVLKATQRSKLGY